jgi:hypothetical protein
MEGAPDGNGGGFVRAVPIKCSFNFSAMTEKMGARRGLQKSKKTTDFTDGRRARLLSYP